MLDVLENERLVVVLRGENYHNSDALRVACERLEDLMGELEALAEKIRFLKSSYEDRDDDLPSKEEDEEIKALIDDLVGTVGC